MLWNIPPTTTEIKATRPPLVRACPTAAIRLPVYLGIVGYRPPCAPPGVGPLPINSSCMPSIRC